MLVPAPWQAAFGQAKPYKIGSEQPLSGAAALGGKTAVVGLQMAIDRINKAGGINGRPLEAVIVDDESKPDVGRRKTEKLLVEDNVDVHVGGFLSNICLACMLNPIGILRLGEYIDCDLVEARHAVGLGPKRDFSSSGECLVRRRE